MTRYEQGFMNKCAEYGVDGRALLGAVKGMRKRAEDDDNLDVMEVSTDSRLDKHERRRLMDELPEDRRKMIKSFLNKLDDNRYTVRTNEYGSPTATYDKIMDRLYYTRAQREERERRIKGKNAFWRLLFMGGQPMVGV